jgi:hypothetical protein
MFVLNNYSYWNPVAQNTMYKLAWRTTGVPYLQAQTWWIQTVPAFMYVT